MEKVAQRPYTQTQRENLNLNVDITEVFKNQDVFGMCVVYSSQA